MRDPPPSWTEDHAQAAPCRYDRMRRRHFGRSPRGSIPCRRSLLGYHGREWLEINLVKGERFRLGFLELARI